MTHRPKPIPDAVGPVARGYANRLRALSDLVDGLAMTPEQRDEVIISANLLESMADGWNVITPQASTGYRLHFVGDQGEEPEMLAAEGLLRGVFSALVHRARLVRATMTHTGRPSILVMSNTWTRGLVANLPAVPMNGRWLLQCQQDGYIVEWVQPTTAPHLSTFAMGAAQ